MEQFCKSSLLAYHHLFFYFQSIMSEDICYLLLVEVASVVELSSR